MDCSAAEKFHETSGAHERILAHLVAEAGVRAMAGHHDGLLIQAVQPFLDGTNDSPLIATPQIGAPYATTEQRIASDQQLVLGEPETHRTRRMPWGVQGHAATAGQLLVVAQPAIRRRHRRVGHAEHLALHLQVFPQRLVGLVQVQRGTGQFLELARGEEMVEVGMGVDDAHQGQAMMLQAGEDLLLVPARVDDDGLFAERVADHNPHAVTLTAISTCTSMWTST